MDDYIEGRKPQRVLPTVSITWHSGKETLESREQTEILSGLPEIGAKERIDYQGIAGNLKHKNKSK